MFTNLRSAVSTSIFLAAESLRWWAETFHRVANAVDPAPFTEDDYEQARLLIAQVCPDAFHSQPFGPQAGS